MEQYSELELNSTSHFALTGRHLGSEHGSQDYSSMLTLSGARIVNEAWLLALVAQRDELLAATAETKGAEDAARRVSACLAACKSISTKALESGDLNVLELQRDRLVLTQRRDALTAQRDWAREQRDELLKALENLLDDNLYADGEGVVMVEKSEFAAAARAAIAKAKAPQFSISSQPSCGEPSERLTMLKLKGPNHITQAEFDAAPKVGPSIAEMQAAGQLPTSERYTHPTKGGVYEKLGVIRGAGALKGMAGIAYRNEAGDLFVREPECFAARMKPIPADGGAQ